MLFDIIIVGAGPVGLFSAFQAGLLGMKSAVIDTQEEIGGQCSALYPSKPIYDIPAYPQITAQQLVDSLYQQAKPFNPQYFLNQQVQYIQQQDKHFVLSTNDNSDISAKAVLIAAGAGAFGPNKPPLPNIEKYEGSCVFYSVQDPQDFAGKKVIIAGGGDSAVDWAIILAEIADVTVVHRRTKFRAAAANVEKMMSLAEQGKLKLELNYQLQDLIEQEGRLSHVEIANLNGETKHVEVDILLPFFGLKQNLGPLHDCGLEIERNSINVSQPHYQTNIPGIYAIGDVANYAGKLKLILTGFAEAASALHHSYERVFDGKPLYFEYSTSKNVR